ncbi:Calcineurin-like phosphoesterase [Pseudonocardia thermophila]|mgnify:CR=1 FL=1|uniref:Calcineurin-like phosphoesterase n=1 Tax=Pseudonocardia thermophila TaxID=1848 RepID=A0A1M6P3G8_PSETH|nr:metallophosphoesterase [Pseudonocardia thermophila]SHK02519.1 Calcineurin-like phosphoesterase [Pseudonocardia thermophila]
MKIAQISDTHLTAADGPTVDGFRLLAHHLNTEVRPDLVVHTGDIQFLHPDVAEDRARSRELLDLIEAPLLVVPGNHDVGMPGLGAWAGLVTTDERVAAHEAVFGPDHWRHDSDEATLLGIDSELLGSGLQREADQWRWLEQTVGELRPGVPVLLFLHKPVWQVTEEPVGYQTDIGPVARDRLLALLARTELRAVGCGHLHRYRAVPRGTVIEVWAPATAYLSAEDDRIEGRHELGFVEWVVAEGAVSAEFRTVPGMPQLHSADVPAIAETIEAMTGAGV